MNFTPKISVGFVVSGILTVAVVGLIGWGDTIAPAPIVATRDAFAAQESFQPGMIVPAVDLTPAAGFQAARPEYSQVSAWYKNKNWWKRNAPIVGGAGGGALIGGLVGGGKGALIGGAAGGGGGYLYKRSKRHHDERRNFNNNVHHDVPKDVRH